MSKETAVDIETLKAMPADELKARLRAGIEEKAARERYRERNIERLIAAVERGDERAYYELMEEIATDDTPEGG